MFDWQRQERFYESPMPLKDGDRVGVIGGGPAGSFFSYFLLESAERVGLKLHVDIYEPKDFTRPGPVGCNMCGGIVSESLVQNLAAEGITLPGSVVQRGIDSYALHMDVGSVRIETPLHEKRIAAIHRGAGPRGIKEVNLCGFDNFMLQKAEGKGALVSRSRVEGFEGREGLPHLRTQDGEWHGYELIVAAVGINSPLLKTISEALPLYAPPAATKTYICEFYMGRELLGRQFGSSMHVFLLNLPRLEFAALIPKGDFLTVCMLGEEIDKELIERFFASEEVRACMPEGWTAPADFCRCSPKISISEALHPFGDRVCFVGDCGSTRLYKDGIGAAYRTAKAAAITAVFDGVAEQDFQRNFGTVCADIGNDNRIGKIVFLVTKMIQHSKTLRRGVLRMVEREQGNGDVRRMSTVLWDTFTGSAPYREVFLRSCHPAFLARLGWETLRGLVHRKQTSRQGASA